MLHQNKLLFYLHFVLVFFYANADQPGSNLTFPDLINIGLDNHPKTKQAWWSAKRAEAIEGTANSAYYPELGFVARGIHGRDFKYLNGPDVNFTIFSADLVLSMLLYDFGTRDANASTAKLALLAARWEADFTMQKVIADILENAYRLNFEIDTLEASQLSLEDAKLMLEISEKLYHSGLNPVSDIYISRSSLALMQIETARRRSLVAIQKAKLATNLNLPIDTDFNLAPISIPSQEQKPRLEELICLANSQRGDLMKKRFQAKAQASNLNRSESQYKPRLSFGARGGFERAVKDKADGGHYEVVVNLDVPLFNGFRNFFETKTAYSEMRGSEEETAELELNIALDVLKFSKTMEAADEMLIYADDNLQNAKKAYEGTLDKYQIGEESIAELINAQKQLAQARILYSDIKTQLLVSIANLAFATGTLSPSVESFCLD